MIKNTIPGPKRGAIVQFLTPNSSVLARVIAAGLLAAAASPLAAQSEGDSAEQMAADAAPVVAAPSAPAPEPGAAPAKPADHISTRVVWSQFADVPVSGDAASTLRYGGKIDAYIDIKGSAVGADDSLSLHIHPEFKYGESSNGTIGLIPANTQLFYPGDGDVFDLSINLTKKWKSGSSLTIGKINILDLAAMIPIQGGGGHDGFQNLSLALPPSAIVPGSVTGALVNIPTKDVLWRVIVFDPELQSRRSGLENPFSVGVGVLASATFPVKIGGQQGYYAIKIAGSSRGVIAHEALPLALVPAPGSGFGDRRGEISAIFAFNQFLSQDLSNPGKGIGIFGQVYFSNGDPTFLDASGFIGIAGNPRARPQDRFGISYFHYSLTDGLVDVLRHRVALEDEEGVEAFYTVQLADRFRLTTNVQIVDSAVAKRKTGVTAGLRLTTTF